ncbi:hypothetical protein [Burkholderia arboris]|uniref:hypothetical protein n=1 Tax=Burkholderia arboris TaxID=488730 RepID=UPI0030F22120
MIFGDGTLVGNAPKKNSLEAALGVDQSASVSDPMLSVRRVLLEKGDPPGPSWA